jgi:hypothetical protein
MNDSSPIAQAALRRAIPNRVRHACQTVLGVLIALTLMASMVHARDLPEGWEARAENNGTAFAPVKMKPGEKFEIWVAGSSYQVPSGASLQSQLPRIRQEAGATQGDKCQPPEVTQDGLVAQNCMLGGSALTYMLLLLPQGGNKAQLLRIHTAGSDEALARYSDGFRQIIKIAMQGQSQTVLRSESKTEAQPVKQDRESKTEAQPAKQDSDRNPDLPDGWEVHRENNGVTFAPVKMNPGEKLEIWAAGGSWSELRRGASLESQLPEIRQKVRATEGNKCQQPRIESGLTMQTCMEGDTVLQYMLLPKNSSYVQLLRVRIAGDGVFKRYNDGYQKTMAIIRQNKAWDVLRHQEQLERERIARAIRTAPGQGVQDGDITAVFVTSQEVKNAGETVTRLAHITWLLLQDGTGYQITIPPDELNIKVSRQQEPKRWVQWRKPLFGNDYEIRGPNDKDWLRLKGWIAQPARSGERLNGAYERTDYSGSMFTGITTRKYAWYFRNDGTYETSYYGNSGYLDLGSHFSVSSSTVSSSKGTSATTGMASTAALHQISGGTSVGTYSNRHADDGASRRGRYRLKGWILELERADGQTERYFVTFQGDKRNMIDLNSNWFEVKHK